MADIKYNRTFQHEDWIDNEDVVQAGGEKGFNKKFHDLEAEFDNVSGVVTTISGAITSIQQLADGVVTTSKIADGAVTNTKIAGNAIDADKITSNSVRNKHIQDGAISSAKLQNNSVASANIQDAAITIKKLFIATVKTASATLAPGQTVFDFVERNVPFTANTIYMPTIAPTNTSGAGPAIVEAQIVYQTVAGGAGVDVLIRLTNKGAAAMGVNWSVFTFGS
jgi:hypothetical protein